MEKRGEGKREMTQGAVQRPISIGTLRQEIDSVDARQRPAIILRSPLRVEITPREKSVSNARGSTYVPNILSQMVRTKPKFMLERPLAP